MPWLLVCSLEPDAVEYTQRHVLAPAAMFGEGAVPEICTHCGLDWAPWCNDAPFCLSGAYDAVRIYLSACASVRTLCTMSARHA